MNHLNKVFLDPNDEFYTKLVDIKKELKKYKSFFKNKVIYCNCDNPYKSNFVKYFAHRFHKFGLKSLIASCYYQKPIDLFISCKNDMGGGR